MNGWKQKKHLFEKERHLSPKPSAVQVPAVNFSGCSLKMLDPSLKGLILDISTVFHGFPLLPVQKDAQAAVMWRMRSSSSWQVIDGGRNSLWCAMDWEYQTSSVIGKMTIQTFFLWGRPERPVTVCYTLRSKDFFSLISLSDCWARRPSIGHDITNPNIAFLRKSLKITIHLLLVWFPPRWVPFNNSCFPG